MAEWKRILLVEDVEINRDYAQLVLEQIGIQVEVAENGAEAVEKVKNTVNGYYDAILMDIQMPIMDGYTAAMQIRQLENKELASIPIIAVTANMQEKDIQRSYEAGMNGHIGKPLNRKKIEQMIGS